MKEFKLKELLLISMKERRSKKILFHPERTVIIGGNETGKSVLLKSIYYTFGAEPHKLHPDWLSAEPISIVKFSVDGENLTIFRKEKVFALFDETNLPIGIYSRVSDLGSALADIFGFKLQLPNATGQVVTPPPAYLFLPFYMDQDKSWSANWESFQKLYLPRTRLDVVNYHTGIRPNEYYTAKNELSRIKENIAVIDKEINMIRMLLKNLKKKMSSADFTIDLDTFQSEITEMLASCQLLNQQQEKHKIKLSNLYNNKIALEAQLLIVRNALAETHKDYEFATHILETIVPCPSCGAEYENSFGERFGIAQDEQRCTDLIVELQEELGMTLAGIEKTNDTFINNKVTLGQIENRLEQKKGEIKLRDVIESEGKREVQKLFIEEITAYDLELGEKIKLRDDLDLTLKDLEDKKRAELIRSKYRILMRENLDLLNLKNVKNTTFQKIDSKLSESGSKTPRELMAYYYSILQVMREFSTSSYCPIVIDSPNQQAQDPENLPKLLNFIIDKQPEGSQLVLSIEEDHGIDYQGDIIRLTEKSKLLQPENYQEHFEYLKPFLTEVYGPKLFY